MEERILGRGETTFTRNKGGKKVLGTNKGPPLGDGEDIQIEKLVEKDGGQR